MAPRRGSSTARPEAGFALIEVMVSALIIVLTVGGVIKLLTATGHASAEERHRAQAFSLAQEDQARLRGIQLAQLNNSMPPRTVTLNQIPFTITSNATFISDTTGTTNCSGSNVKADYVRVGSTVTWPNMRGTGVRLESIVSPVSGSFDPINGGLAITVNNAKAKGIAEAGLSGTGAGTFSGSTDANGCALFGGLPAGNYSVVPNLSSEYVDHEGEEPKATEVTVSAGPPTPLTLEYDRGATVTFGFETRLSGGTWAASEGDSVVAAATGLQSKAKTFWTTGKTPQTALTASKLFPFPYTYNFYAGACTTNKPTEGSLNIELGPGEVRPGKAMLKIPALYLTVKNSNGTLANLARVTLQETTCSSSLKRVEATNSSGTLDDPGLPYGTYSICASVGTKKATTTKEVRSLTGTSVTLTLPSTNTSACP